MKTNGIKAKNEQLAQNDEGDVIQQAMGGWGRWHVWICFVIFMVKFPVAWHQLNIVIEGAPTNFTCEGYADQCDPRCRKHIYDRSVFQETIISEFGLVCAKTTLANFAQTSTMLGILVGNVIFGYWSDRCGRRDPMVYAVMIQLVAGVAQAFVPWYWALLILRFIACVATGGTMLTSFVMVMEIVGKKYRTIAATVYQIPFNLGHLSLAVLGYYIRTWRLFQLVISLPSILLLSYWFLLPESPKWLIATGKVDKGIKVVTKFAKHNKLPTENIESDIKAFAESNKSQSSRKGGNIKDLFSTRNMASKTIFMSLNWLACGLCFFGVAQYIGQLGGDMFLNIAVSAAIQIPGTFLSIILMEKLGRKTTLITVDMIAGLPMFIIPFLPNNGWAQPSAAIVAMFGLSMVFPTVYIYSGELYPTVVRNVGCGTNSMCARIGSLIAPHITTLGLYTAFWVPPLIFGIAPIIGAVLCFWLPETKGVRLPNTIEEAEQLKRGSGESERPSAEQAPEKEQKK